LLHGQDFWRLREAGDVGSTNTGGNNEHGGYGGNSKHCWGF
jgi:hypothetical protein